MSLGWTSLVPGEEPREQWKERSAPESGPREVGSVEK